MRLILDPPWKQDRKHRKMSNWTNRLGRAWRRMRRQGVVSVLHLGWHELCRWSRWRRPGPPLYSMTPPTGLLGMTMPEEQAWLLWYASQCYRAEGLIADLGCWMGSTTVPLAIGLAENQAVGEKDGQIHAFDIFEWQNWMDDFVVGTALEGRFAVGDSFLEAFKEVVAPWQASVRVHPGDLTTTGWPPGRPIELLFNDISKTWELASTVVRDFYPHLIPGVSRVVEQDFAHFYTSWVHLLCYRFREYFEPELHIPFSGSSVFRYTRPIPRALLSEDHGPDSFTAKEAEDAFAYSLEVVSDEMRPNVWAAKAMHYHHRGEFDRARHEVALGRQKGLYRLDLVRVDHMLRAEK